MVVATYNRAGLLHHLLDALAAQNYPADRMEVVIVDDSSTDDTEQVVEAWGRTAPFEVRLFSRPRGGPGPSRAYGVEQARGEVIAFTDSDCVPDRGWLRSAACHLGEGVGLVTGTIALARMPDTHFFFNSQLDAEVKDRGLYRTANLIVPKAVYQAVGGFDPAFAYSGEDTDLGWRIRQSGLRALFIDTVRVTHLATPVSIGDWMRKPMVFQVMPRLLRRHPEIRRTALWARCFMSPRHFVFDVAVAAVVLAAATRLWVVLLLLVPWLVASSDAWLEMARLGRLHKAAAIQFLLLERFGLGLAVLLWSSFRYRRLVL